MVGMTTSVTSASNTPGSPPRSRAQTGIAEGENPVPVILEHTLGEEAHGRLVLDEQDRLGPAVCALARGGRVGACGRRPIERRQVDPKDAAGARTALDIDVALRLLDDAVHAREPKSGALAGRLGREEGLEEMRLGRLVHPDARVGDLEQDVAAGLRPRVRSARRLRSASRA